MPFYFSFFLLSNFFFVIVIPLIPSRICAQPRLPCTLLTSSSPVMSSCAHAPRWPPSPPSIVSVVKSDLDLPVLGHWCRWNLGEAVGFIPHRSMRICFQELHLWNCLKTIDWHQAVPSRVFMYTEVRNLKEYFLREKAFVWHFGKSELKLLCLVQVAVMTCGAIVSSQVASMPTWPTWPDETTSQHGVLAVLLFPYLCQDIQKLCGPPPSENKWKTPKTKSVYMNTLCSYISYAHPANHMYNLNYKHKW